MGIKNFFSLKNNINYSNEDSILKQTDLINTKIEEVNNQLNNFLPNVITFEIINSFIEQVDNFSTKTNLLSSNIQSIINEDNSIILEELLKSIQTISLNLTKLKNYLNKSEISHLTEEVPDKLLEVIQTFIHKTEDFGNKIEIFNKDKIISEIAIIELNINSINLLTLRLIANFQKLNEHNNKNLFISESNYSNLQINNYIKYMESNSIFAFVNIKNSVIVGFFIFLVTSYLVNLKKKDNFNFIDVQIPFNYDTLNLITNYLWNPILCAFLINLFLAIILRMFIYLSTLQIYRAKSITSILIIFKEYRIKEFKELYLMFFSKEAVTSNFFKQLFFFFLSPDYFAANHFKNKLIIEVNEKEKNDSSNYKDTQDISVSQWNSIKILLQNFIIKSNWINVCTSILLTLLGILIVYKDQENTECMLFLLTIVFFRLISRGFEIAIAFYKDVVTTNSKLFLKIKVRGNGDGTPYIKYEDAIYINGFKSSLIREGARLSLALHSLLELFFTFALAYFLLFNVLSQLDNSYFSISNDSWFIETLETSQKLYTIKEEEVISFTPPNYVEAFLISSSLGLFNISYSTYQNILLSFLHFYQVFLSVVLILLSIARYLTNDKSLSVQDERLYKIAAIEKYKKKRTIHEDDINNYLEKHLNYSPIKVKSNNNSI